MGSLHISYALDRDYMFTVDAREGCQAGVDTGMVYLLGCRVVLTNDDCTSTTATLSAATLETAVSIASIKCHICSLQLRPSQANAPQIFQQGHLGVDFIKHHSRSVEKEADGVVVSGRESRMRKARVSHG